MSIYSFSIIFFVFILGLKHGLEPDHMAVVDSITFNIYQKDKPLSKMTGLFFSLGHGLTITLIAFFISYITISIHIPKTIISLGEILPLIILFILGSINLKNLLFSKNLESTKIKILPSKLKNSVKPLSIFFIGVIFALVFETITQSILWSQLAKGNPILALILGVFFTLGMLITSSLDCNLLYFVLENKKSINVDKYRKIIGWFTVIFSYFIVFYSLLDFLHNP